MSFLLDRKSPSHYLSDPHEWFSGNSRHTIQPSGLRTGPPDLASDNQKAWRFAIDAVLAQPLDYTMTVARDTAYTVLLADPPVNGFGFEPASPYSLSPRELDMLHHYAHADARTQITGFPATALRYYQDRIFLSGVQFTLILAVGLVGVVRRRRHCGGPGLLPWATAAALLVLPAATAQGHPRYGIPAMPLACLAAALAFTRITAEHDPAARDRPH